MIEITRTDSNNQDFILLVRELDDYLAEMDGEEHGFYAQYNGLQQIKHVVLAYDGEIPVGCGAIKAFDSFSMEIKRMYVLPEYRGQRIASKILEALEQWADELNYGRCILETGLRQVEAVKLYKRENYVQIDNYGQYAGVENSVCFEKKL